MPVYYRFSPNSWVMCSPQSPLWLGWFASHDLSHFRDVMLICVLGPLPKGSVATLHWSCKSPMRGCWLPRRLRCLRPRIRGGVQKQPATISPTATTPGEQRTWHHVAVWSPGSPSSGDRARARADSYAGVSCAIFIRVLIPCVTLAESVAAR